MAVVNPIQIAYLVNLPFLFDQIDGFFTRLAIVGFPQIAVFVVGLFSRFPSPPVPSLLHLSFCVWHTFASDDQLGLS